MTDKSLVLDVFIMCLLIYVFSFTFQTINNWPPPEIDGPNELMQLKLFICLFVCMIRKGNQNPVLGSQAFYGDKQDRDSQENLGL